MSEKTPFKRRWIDKEDRPFLIILIISTLFHLIAAVYLNTIEIKKKELEEAIKEIPHRFARLLLQPPEEIIKKVILKPLPLGKAGIEKEEKTALAPAKTEEVMKEAGVRYKGLLGVIMAKAGPKEISTAAVFRDIDKVMKEVKREGPGDRVKDVLSGLHIKEVGKAEGVSIGISKPLEPQPLDTSEIAKEKKEVLLGEEEVDKKKVATVSFSIKKYEADMYAAMLSYAGGLKYLYNNALRKDPSLKGRITVKMVISPAGKASEVTIVSSTLNAPELEKAIADRIYMWRFPAFKWAESFTITYTLDFSIG